MNSKPRHQLFWELTSHVARTWRVVVYNFQKVTQITRNHRNTKYAKIQNCSRGKKTKIKQYGKIKRKRPRKSATNSVSQWGIWNDFWPPTRESHVFIKQQFYNRIASLSKETFGFYLTLEKRRNVEDLVEHFPLASVFAKAHEPVTCAYTCFICQKFCGCYEQNTRGICLGLWAKFKIYSSLIWTRISRG